MTKRVTAITQDYLESLIVKEQYHTYEGTTFTTCLLHLENGYKLHGQSAYGDPDDETVARQFARSNAMGKLWGLEGYLLQQALHEELLRDAALLNAKQHDTP